MFPIVRVMAEPWTEARRRPSEPSAAAHFECGAAIRTHRLHLTPTAATHADHLEFLTPLVSPSLVAARPSQQLLSCVYIAWSYESRFLS